MPDIKCLPMLYQNIPRSIDTYCYACGSSKHFGDVSVGRRASTQAVCNVFTNVSAQDCSQRRGGFLPKKTPFNEDLVWQIMGKDKRHQKQQNKKNAQKHDYRKGVSSRPIKEPTRRVQSSSRPSPSTSSRNQSRSTPYKVSYSAARSSTRPNSRY
jgi:hypothetical protein